PPPVKENAAAPVFGSGGHALAQPEPSADDAIEVPEEEDHPWQPRDEDSDEGHDEDEGKHRARHDPQEPEPERARKPRDVALEIGAADIGPLHRADDDGDDREQPRGERREEMQEIHHVEYVLVS